MANYSTTANVVLTMNGRQAQQMMKSLQQEASDLEKKIEKAAKAGDKASAKKFQRELNSVNKQIDQLRGGAAKVEQVLTRLDKATPRELNRAMKELKRQMEGIERGSEAWNQHIDKIKKVRAQIRELNDEMKEDETLWQRFKNFFNEFGLSIAGVVATVVGLRAAFMDFIDSYAEMEQEEANVRKYTGMTEEQVKQLNDEFKKMDTRTSREQLNKLAQDAGRLGKSSIEDVMGFVRAADVINVALDDLGDGATLTLSKLTGVFGVEQQYGTEQALLKTGSVINELSQNCSASAPYIAEFTSRLGGVGSQANMSVQDIMAFAAVLDSAGQNVEKSSTALSNFIVHLMQDPAKYAKAVGLEVESFTRLLKQDANAALIEFLGALNKMGNMDALAPLFADMKEKGSGMVQTLSTLAKNIDQLKIQQENAAVAFEEGTSVIKEFDVQNNTVQATLEKSQKSLKELKIELGQQLLPVMRLVMSGTSMFIQVVRETVNFVIKYKGELLFLVSAIGSYIVAANAAAIKTAALNTIMKIKAVTVNTLKGALYLLQVAYFKVTANTEKATIAMENFNRVSKANPWGMIASLAVAAAGAIYSFAKRTDEAAEAEKQAAKEAEEFEKSLTDLSQTASQNAEKELSLLDMLYTAATNDTLAREDRINAVVKMQELYPDLFKNMSQEEIMLGNAKKAYVDLRDAILETAKAKAASDKIAENSGLLVQYEMSLDELNEQRKSLKEQFKVTSDEYYKMRQTIKERIKANHGLDSYNRDKQLANPENYWWDYGDNKERTQWGTIVGTRSKIAGELARVNEEIVKASDAKGKINEANNKLYEKYGLGNLLSNTEGGYDKPEPPEVNVPTVTNTSSNNDKFQMEKEWREQQEALSRISFATGQASQIEHNSRMLEIEKDFYNKQLSHTDLSENERLKIIAQLKEVELKMSDEKNKQSVESENQRHAASIAELKQFYIDGQISKETYDMKSEEAEIEHQNNFVKITKEGSNERAQAEARLQDLQIAQMQRRQKEAEELKKKYDDIKKEYFGDNAEESKAKMEAALADLEIVYQNELLAAGDNAAEKLRIEEAYQQARLAIIKKYSGEGEKENKNAIGQFAEWLNSDGGKAVTGAMGTMVSGMSAIFSQLNSLMQADLEMQTARIEKKYDKEIELAEGNSYRVAALEKKKEKEIAQVKNEANRKMFAMQVIQAVAQTAQNALSAYGSAARIPVVGHILAPIAAAMAVAAGAIQIAAIKKQQQASEAQGYAEGGFTPAGAKYQEVGIVHAGEWVASQELVNNPRTRPILEALDYAQKNNSIGSLRMKDVSRTISPQNYNQGASSAAGVGGVNVISVESERQMEMMIALGNTIEALNKRLTEPFAAIATVAGDYGINKAQADYTKLMKNKSPKFKK